MPELTIRLRTNPETGRKDIVVHLKEDDDAMPHEHEQLHRSLVEQLLNGGILQKDEVGELIVDRIEPESEDAGVDETTAPQRESQSESE